MNFSRSIALCTLAVVGLTAFTAGAEAKRAFRFVANGQAITDGERWAVIHPPPRLRANTPVLVLDTKAHTSFSLYRPDGRCDAMAVGAGRLLWSCPDPQVNQRPVVTNLVTRESAEPPGWPALRERYGGASGSDFRPSGVGRSWIEVDVLRFHGPTRAFLNSRTGAQVIDGPVSPREYADLDDEALVKPLCSPLARRRHPDGGDPFYDGPSFLDPVVSGPYALYDQAGPGVLRRCGRRRGFRLHGCDTELCSPQLGAGYVTWTGEWQIGAYFPRRKRSLKLGTLRGSLPVSLQHTRNRVFATSERNATYVRRLPLTAR